MALRLPQRDDTSNKVCNSGDDCVNGIWGNIIEKDIPDRVIDGQLRFAKAGQ